MTASSINIYKNIVAKNILFWNDMAQYNLYNLFVKTKGWGKCLPHGGHPGHPNFPSWYIVLDVSFDV